MGLSVADTGYHCKFLIFFCRWVGGWTDWARNIFNLIKYKLIITGAERDAYRGLFAAY